MAAKRRRRAAWRVFAGFIALALLLAGAVLAAQRLLSPGFVAEQLAGMVRRQTGRTLTIGSAPVLTFWPSLSVRLTDVSLSNPPGMAAGRFLRVGKLELSVALRPLLRRRLVVRTIRLTAPEISLVVDTQGRANWVFGEKAQAAPAERAPSAADAPAGGLLSSVRMAPVVIREGKVRYLDERSATALAVDSVNLTLSLPTPESPLRLKGSAVWRASPVRFVLFVRAPQKLALAGSPLDVTLDAPRLKAAYSGFAGLRGGLELAGRIEASGPSLRGLFSWLGAQMPAGRGLGAFSAKGAIGVSGGRVELKKAEVSLDGMRARGTVRIFPGRRLRVSAALGVDRIDANAYMRPPAQAAGTKEPAGAARPPADWSDAPLDMSPLRGLDADLRLAAGAILFRDVRIGRSEATAKLRDGVLDVTLKKMAFYGGAASGRLILDGSRKKPAVRGALRATGISGGRLLRDLAGMTSLRGRLDASLSLAASGASQREMVSMLKGEARLRFADGAIRGVNVARLVRTVREAVVNGWKKAPREKTDFAELSASFRIADGIAGTKDLRMIGPLVRLTGSGEVDLLRRRLDLRVNPKLVGSLKGQGGRMELAGLPVPVIVRGPWDNPKIYPDIRGVLSDPAGAYRRLRKLISAAGAGDAAKAAADIGRRGQKKLEEGARKELSRVMGDEKAEKTVKKTKKKAKKLLKKLLR